MLEVDVAEGFGRVCVSGVVEADVDRCFAVAELVDFCTSVAGDVDGPAGAETVGGILVPAGWTVGSAPALEIAVRFADTPETLVCDPVVLAVLTAV